MAQTLETANAQQQPDAATGSQPRPEDIHLPPPSFWPIILALGFSLIMAGLAASIALAISGLIIVLVATVGWVIEPTHVEEEHS